jgi:hypothetical protein
MQWTLFHELPLFVRLIRIILPSLRGSIRVSDPCRRAQH